MTFVRYFLVQLVAYFIDMGGFLLLLKMDVDWLVANIVSKLLAGLFAFLAHRHFTFSGATATDSRIQAFKYFLLLSLNLPLSTLVLGQALKFVSYPVVAKFIADAICILFTFWLSKRVVFSKSEGEVATTPAPEKGIER